MPLKTIKKITKKIEPVREEPTEEEDFEEEAEITDEAPSKEESSEEIEEIYSYSKLKGDTFIGSILDAGIESLTSKFTGDTRKVYYLSLETDYLSFPIKVRYKVSDRKNSAWGNFLKALEENCRIRIKNSIKELVGKTFEWERTVLEFGQFSSNVVLPIRLVKEE